MKKKPGGAHAYPQAYPSDSGTRRSGNGIPAEMLDNGDSLDGCAALEDTNSYAEWADFEGRLRERYGEGYVPSDVYLAVRKSDDRLVGMISPGGR